MKIINNFWNLAKYGYLPKEKIKFKNTLFLGLKLILILIFFKLLSFGLYHVLHINNIFTMPTHLGRGILNDYSPFVQLLIITIYAPIFEELLFRIGLKFSKWNFIIMTVGLSYFGLRIIPDFEWFHRLIIALIIGIIIFLNLNKNNLDFLSKFWIKNKRMIFYGLLLLFGLIHLVNYDLNLKVLSFTIIIILPHIIGGFVYSYARFNSGIILAICLHSLNNGLPKLITMIAG